MYLLTYEEKDSLKCLSITSQEQKIICHRETQQLFVQIQSNFDLVTVNLVTILDLVTFFRKTNFLCSKNSRFSDILENSRTLI